MSEVKEVDTPIESSIVAETVPSPAALRRLGLRRPAPEKKDYSQEVDDEFGNAHIEVLRPLKEVKFEAPTLDHYGLPTERKEEEDFTPQIAEDLGYLSRTRGLETGTERAQVLQDIVDRMTRGTEVEARVVIMHKGSQPNGFVMPDGTIFVAQALINKLGSLDEIGGVLAHEVGHLLNRTFERQMQSRSIFKLKDFLGVGWVHEMASDAASVELLEKAGLNTLAFASAIEKIAGARRGYVHQSGLSRASESVGQHLAIHYGTSEVTETPKPVILDGEAKETNLEVFENFLDNLRKYDVEGLRPILERLHPKDLLQAYNTLLSHGFYDKQEGGEPRPGRICNEILLSKLQRTGYKEPEAILFLRLVAYKMEKYGRNDYLFGDPQVLIDVSEVLGEFEREGKMDKMARDLFSKPVKKLGWLDKGPIQEFMEVIMNEMYNPQFGPQLVQGRKRETPYQSRAGIPVTDDALLAFLSKVAEVEQKSQYDSEQIRQQSTRLLLEWVDMSYLRMAAEAGQSVDEEQIRDFFERAKAQGIKVEDPRRYVEEGKSILDTSGKAVISRENQEVVLRVFQEVFGIEKQKPETREAVTFEQIDQFFEHFQKEGGYNIDTFLYLLQRSFLEQHLNDHERLRYIDYIYKKIDSLALESKIPIQGLLEDVGQYKTRDDKRYYPRAGEIVDLRSNELIMKFNLRAVAGLALFKSDGDEFYRYMEKTMQESGIDPSQLSRIQLINLCLPFLVVDQGSGTRRYIDFKIEGAVADSFRDGVGVADYERFFQLPFIKAILEKEEPVDASTIKELSQHLEAQLNKVLFDFSDNSDDNLFNDTLLSLVFGRQIRTALLTIPEKGVGEGEYGDLYEFISRYYPSGIQKEAILREVNKGYLRSTKVPFVEKVEYLVKFFDQVGPEGMLVVAEEIQDLARYRFFRSRIEGKLEEYMQGSTQAAKVAAVDLLTGVVGEHFRWLLASARLDDKARREKSTSLAATWFDRLFSRFGNRQIPYDREAGKFIVEGKKRREVFRTIADTFAFLKGLSPSQRFAVAHKALTEELGALSSLHAREELAKTLVGALGLKSGFVASALATLCKKGEAKLLGFPVSRMLSPLLFRGLDVSAVDKRELFGEWISTEEDKSVHLDRVLPRKDILRIMRSRTRDVTIFGNAYRKQPNSPAGRLAGESDQQYSLSLQRLEALFAEEEQPANRAEDGRLDTALEAVVRGVEASGAVGVRSLQLATQLHRFSEKVERRLSEAFDSNPGLNKLFFWENLLRVARENGEAGAFLEKIRLDGYLGGGSLYTVYAATIGVHGVPREVVVKMLNPNAAAFVKESSDLARDVLETVAQQGRSTRRYAQLGLMLADLSRQWCIKDINDPTFAEDDDRFKSTIDKFNDEAGTDFFAPQRVLTSHRVKVEDRVQGMTLNKLLKEEAVSQKEKREALERVARFFTFQLREPLVDEEGRKQYLVHSDPHVGNYVVDLSGETPRIGVIDRSMYIKLAQEDVDVLKLLLQPGNETRFLNAFVGRVLDVNKVRNRQQRSRIWISTWSGIARELGRQFVGRRGTDNFSILRVALGQLVNQKMEVPLELRLMIRNVGALKALMGRHGLKLEDYV